jgi:hypothetical protein
MLSASARTALLAALLSGRVCAEIPASSGVVEAPVVPAAPTSRASASPVDPSTAEERSDASVSIGADAGAPARFRACNGDADCLAVPRVGCCHNGWKEAVAASQQDAYAASFVCPEAHPICAMFLVRDTRVPVCDAATRLCTLAPGR